MKGRSFLIVATLVLILMCGFNISSIGQIRPNKLAISAGATFGVFTDDFVNDIYSGHPSFRGSIGYEYKNWGLHGFSDYFKIKGKPFIEANGDFNIRDAGAKMKGTTFGLELRRYIGESFFLGVEAGIISIDEDLWLNDISTEGQKDGNLYGVGIGYEFKISGPFKGEFQAIYTSANIKSEGKDLIVGNEQASLGKLSVCLSIKY